MSTRLTRRSFLQLAGAGAAGVVWLHPFGRAVAAASRQPNFLFLLSDDQDWTGLSVQMHDRVPNSKSDFYRTPNLEKLAVQGMRFTDAYAPSPVCSPTRYSLQTGKSPAQLHWTKAGPVMTAEEGYKLLPPPIVKQIDPAETTIGELLQRAGYATAHYGKWHLSGGGPEAHGYEESDGDTSNKDAAPFTDPNPVDIFGMVDRAGTFMAKQVKAGKPFFAQLSFHALHYPENALRASLEACRNRPPGAMHSDVARAAITEDLDTGVGRLLAKLDELGLAENTYVLYMSDNGGGGGGRGSRSRPIRGGKGCVWEGGIRVPLIVRGPGVAPNSFCHVPVIGWDLLPTLCELAGVAEPLPEGVEGGSFVPLLRQGDAGRVNRPREELVFHFPHYQGETPQSAIRLGDLKLVRQYETGTDQLFDLSKDLGEQHDLSKELPEKVAALGRRLDEYFKAVAAQLPKANPDYDPAKQPQPKRGGKRRGKERKTTQ